MNQLILEDKKSPTYCVEQLRGWWTEAGMNDERVEKQQRNS